MKFLEIIACATIAVSSQLSFSAGKDISEDEAKKIALAKVPGEIKEVERENEHGQDVFSVEIAKGDKIFEVHVNPKTGQIIRVEEERPGSTQE